MKFSEQLRLLGFGSYAEYLASEHWADFRRQYKSAGLRMTCLVCACKPIQLHHRTYVRLGRERVEDVIPVCRAHHTAIHDWLKTSGKRFVEFTHEAVAALGGECPAPSRQRVTEAGKAIGLRERDEGRAKKKSRRREKQARRFRRLESIRKRKRTEREAVIAHYQPELRRLVDAGAIRGGEFVAACQSCDVERAESLIRKGRERLARGIKVGDGPLLKTKPRVAAPFQLNAKPVVPSGTGSWSAFVARMRGEKKEA